jgi:hypothetical protein
MGIRLRYPPAFLTVRDDRSFELVVADKELNIQTMSFWTAKRQWWRTVRAIPDRRKFYLGPPDRGHRPAVVLGRTVHWLYLSYWCLPYIIAVEVDAAVATKVLLPQECRSRLTSRDRTHDKDALLAAVGGRLRLLVAERMAVEMWTLATSTPAPEWSRHVVIDEQQMETQAGLRQGLLLPIQLEGFCR